MQRTRERDAAAVGIAEELSWIPVRIWECQIIADPAAAAQHVLAQSGAVA